LEGFRAISGRDTHFVTAVSATSTVFVTVCVTVRATVVTICATVVAVKSAVTGVTPLVGHHSRDFLRQKRHEGKMRPKWRRTEMGLKIEEKGEFHRQELFVSLFKMLKITITN
jgi:hypothetical protein